MPDENSRNDEPQEGNGPDDGRQEEKPSAPPEGGSEAQCAEYRAAWQRALADYDNLKKESERQRLETVRYACADLVARLLPAVESLRQSSAHEPAPAAGTEYPAEVAQWIGGVRAIRQQIDAVLAQAGVEMIDAAGVPFDPNVHEAMTTRAVEGSEPGTVAEVLEAGAKLHGRLVKPARVIVSE